MTTRRAFLLGGSAAVVAATLPTARVASGPFYVGHIMTRNEALAMYGRNYFDVIREYEEANLTAVRLQVAMSTFIKPKESPCT